MTLPQFWLLPLANLLAEVWEVAPASSPPKMLIDVRPPGGAWRRVVERSVITLPQFWLLPLAKWFEEVLMVR